jgi:predicted metal-dependent phosphoesterase TrpH
VECLHPRGGAASEGASLATTLFRNGEHSPRHDTEPWLPAPRGAASGSATVIWGAVAASAVTLLVAAGAIWRAAPLEALAHGAATGNAAAVLQLSRAYVALSPICEGYDALTLLALSQHAALLGWLFAAFAALRAVRLVRGRDAAFPARRGWRALRHEAMLVAIVLFAFVAVYVAGAIIPRPMAALALDDRDELAVDVHSHTSVSHDGRPGFDAEANRRWHAAAGFAAAYITDHRYYDGAVAGELGNPRTAGEGTVLLPGIESVAPQSRVTILGARAAMKLDDHGRLDVARLAEAPGVVVVLTAPVALARIPDALPLNAIEASDGAPRGLMFTRRWAPTIARFADSRGVVAVAGSNNHGWGRTATAWTVLRIPGWRALSPDSLDRAIRSTLLANRGAVRVVARSSVAAPRSINQLFATPLLLVWGTVTRLSGAERVSWLAWAWTLAGLALLIARRPGSSENDDVLAFEARLPNARLRKRDLARQRRRAAR